MAPNTFFCFVSKEYVKEIIISYCKTLLIVQTTSRTRIRAVFALSDSSRNLAVFFFHFVTAVKVLAWSLQFMMKVRLFSIQCRREGNICGGARERRRREPLQGSGLLPQKILKSRGLEMPFPAFSKSYL